MERKILRVDVVYEQEDENDRPRVLKVARRVITRHVAEPWTEATVRKLPGGLDEYPLLHSPTADNFDVVLHIGDR